MFANNIANCSRFDPRRGEGGRIQLGAGPAETSREPAETRIIIEDRVSGFTWASNSSPLASHILRTAFFPGRGAAGSP